MRSLLLASAVALAAAVAVGCAPSVSDTKPGGTPTPTPSSTPTPAGNHITTNTTWSGSYTMTGDTVVDPGVTLTVTSGSTITVATNATLKVAGVLNAPALLSTTGGTYTVFGAASGTWGGIDVLSGGQATLKKVMLRNAATGLQTEIGALVSKAYLVQFSAVSTPVNFNGDLKLCRASFVGGTGEIYGNAGTLTVSDSDLHSGSAGDATHNGGGNVVITHIHDGNTGGSTSYHCLIHQDGGTISIDKSSFDSGVYLLMIAPGVTASIHNSNIVVGSISNLSGGGATIDATNNYWGSASAPTAPSGWTITPNSATPITDAGPRPFLSTGACEVDPTF